jgi:hypothetical protein
MRFRRRASEGVVLKYEFPDIDCSSFIQPRKVEGLMTSEPTDGLIHVLEFRAADGTVYEGPTPFMVQRNAIGFLQRENGIADARRRGYRWRR